MHRVRRWQVAAQTNAEDRNAKWQATAFRMQRDEARRTFCVNHWRATLPDTHTLFVKLIFRCVSLFNDAVAALAVRTLEPWSSTVRPLSLCMCRFAYNTAVQPGRFGRLLLVALPGSGSRPGGERGRWDAEPGNYGFLTRIKFV